MSTKQILPIGWRQLDSLTLAVNNNANVPIVIPGIEEYRKYCLAIQPANISGFLLTNTTETTSAVPLTAGLPPLVVGPYDASEILFLRLSGAGPRNIIVTPFASKEGELTVRPYDSQDSVVSLLLAAISAAVAAVQVDIDAIQTNQEGCVYELPVAQTDVDPSAAGTVTIGTVGATHRVRVLGVSVVAEGATSADFTSIAINAGAAGVLTLISAGDGIRNNLLTADMQVSWDGGNAGVVLDPADTITATYVGGGVGPVSFAIYIRYSPITTGGVIT